MSTTEESPTTGRLGWLWEKLDAWEVPAQGLMDRAALRVAPVPLEELADPLTAPAAVGRAWKAVMDRGVKTEAADLVVLLLVHRALEMDPGVAHTSLRAADPRFKRDRTWFEVHFRLAGVLNELARAALHDERTEAARRLYAALLHEGEVINVALSVVDFSEHQLRRFHGMRGVASLILARKDDDAAALLAYADGQLALAERCGDVSPEHFRYHVEVKVRRADLAMHRARTGQAAQAVDQDRVPQLLSEAEDLLDRGAELALPTRELAAAEGDVAFRWGLHLLAIGDGSGALSEFERSVGAYEAAEGEARTAHACPDPVLSLLRGQARFRVHIGRQATVDWNAQPDILEQRSTEDDEDTEPTLLDTAIAELAVGATAVSNTSYPDALLSRARGRLWTRDVDGALNDIDTALSYLRDVGWLTGDTVTAPPVNTAQVVRQVRIAEVLKGEAALRRATEAADVEETERLLDLLLTVDDVPLHSTALAQAAFLLCSARQRADCADRLNAVSRRLEQQLARLRSPARRSFVASRAATLSALAFGDVVRTAELERVHELFQTALPHGGEANPVLRRHAAVAALKLACRLQAGDERRREEAVQLLRDALALLLSVLGEHTASVPGDAGTAELAEAEALVDEMTDPASTGAPPEPSARPDTYDESATALEEPDPGPDRGDDLLVDGRLDDAADELLDTAGELPNHPLPEPGAPDAPLDERLRDDWLARAPQLPTDPERAALESRIGECHMRLHLITGDEDHAERALYHFARSRHHDNLSGNLLGLVGDVYYRLGRDRQNPKDLRLAVSCKSAARDLGYQSRENWSVSSAAHHMLFRRSNSPTDLAEALRCADEAGRLAPDWPWPLFQLAELSSVPEQHREWATHLLDGRDRTENLRLSLAGARGELLSRAARLVVRDEEFDRQGMGGRMEGAVYFVDDPHRLLSSTVVIKERPTGFARTESELLTGFAAWTDDHEQSWIKVPEVIDTVPLPPARAGAGRDVALVMRRMSGRPVSALVADRKPAEAAPDTTDVVEVADRVLHALASFHHWRGPCPDDGDRRSTVRERLEEDMRVHLAAAGRAVDNTALTDLWSGTASLPLAAQRDAHADNWLIPAFPGRPAWIAPIDLEASDWRPVLFEVAQFIEDFALLPVDDQHFTTRVDLATRYLHHLPPQPALLALRDDPVKVRRAYETFALARAAFLQYFLASPRRAHTGLSTGSRRLKRVRQAHCEAIVAYLAGSAFPDVAAVASAC
ncbi:hypothetical protein [Streptomyces capitiformicae]|uniref:Uncharacterized protein n=1 Tax=Streptomyces capitiformicae TaxID=2014920 RepID=A0A919GBX4_9ACTN|nr:hypothetical protein [Streptomyces capitiformicae]GHH81393.1 hypothetical protein GCM10017771_03190 [Streptomyces capitiformicae]